MTFSTEAKHSTGEVILVSGVPRGTFDQWLLRRYLPLPPGEGTGSARRYSELDVVRVVATARLARLGVTTSVAAIAASQINAEHDGAGNALVLVHAPEPQPGRLFRTMPVVKLLQFSSLDDIGRQLDQSVLGPHPEFVIANVGAITEHVRTVLANPATKFRAVAIDKPPKSYWERSGEVVDVPVPEHLEPARRRPSRKRPS